MPDRLTVPEWRNIDPWECCQLGDKCKLNSFDPGGCNHGCIVPKLYYKLAQIEDALDVEVPK